MSVTDELLKGINTAPPPERKRETLSSVTDEMLGIGQAQRAERAQQKSEAIADPRRSAGAGAAFRGGVPTNKQDAIKMFAEARGIPTSRYKVIDGNIAYQGDDGRFYREVVMPLETAAYYAPDVLEAAPSLAAGIATAPMSPAINIPVTGAVGAGANYLRQKISQQMTGGEIDPVQVGVSGLLSAAFEGVPAIAKLARERRLASDIGSIEPGRVDRLGELSRRTNIPLTPAELTDLSSLQAQQKVLGNIPSSSKTMQRFYEKREVENIQPAVQDFLAQISRVDEPTQAGQMGLSALQGRKETLEAAREQATAPLYRAAFERSKPVNVSDVVMDIDSQLKTAKGQQASTLNKIKSYLYKDAPRLDAQGNEIIEKVLEDRLPALQNAKFNIDALFKEESFGSLDAKLQRQLKGIQENLVNAMGRENPAYLEANKAFADLSAPLTEFGQRKTGTSLTQISPDNLNQFAQRVFAGNSPDTVSYVKQQIAATNPEAWQAVTRAYLQDTWEQASKPAAQQKGMKLDVGNAWSNILLGDTNRKKMLQRALEPAQFQALSDLTEVLRASGSVKKLGSDTAFNQQIMKQMEKEAAADPMSMAAKMVGNVLSPQTIGTKISEWAMERSLARDAGKIADMITSPEGIKKLRELRQMSPTSAKRWAGTAQLLGNYGIIELKD
jgi:hypothetical protein